MLNTLDKIIKDNKMKSFGKWVGHTNIYRANSNNIKWIARRFESKTLEGYGVML